MRALRPTLLIATLATLSVITVLVPACSDGSGDDGDPDVTFEPRSGVWSFMGSAPVDDTCGYPDLYVDPPGQFTLTNHGDGSFTINDSQNAFDCAIEESKFVCPERTSGENDVGAAYGLDAVVTYTIVVNGTLSSESAMSGRQTIQIVCNGADCATVEATVGVSTPCGWAQDFTATAQ